MTDPALAQPQPPPHAVLSESLSMLVHAESKTGKTTLTATAPRPILALDVEGGWRFIPLRKVAWDPLVGPPPVYDGTWDACVVTVREWAPVERAYAWLTQYQHQFQTIIIDSITELQRRCKANLKGSEAMKIQDWGALLDVMAALIRQYRDLTLIPNLPVRCVIFVAETKMQNGKWAPSMQGQIGNALPYWMDLVGYIYLTDTADANGQPTGRQRMMLATTHPQYVAGERLQGRLPDVIPISAVRGGVGTDVSDWLTQIYAGGNS